MAYPLMCHVHAQVPSSVHNRAQSQTNQRTTVRIHNKLEPQPRSPPQQSLFDSTRGCPLRGLLTLPYLSFWRRLGTVGTLQQQHVGERRPVRPLARLHLPPQKDLLGMGCKHRSEKGAITAANCPGMGVKGKEERGPWLLYQMLINVTTYVHGPPSLQCRTNRHLHRTRSALEGLSGQENICEEQQW